MLIQIEDTELRKILDENQRLRQRNKDLNRYNGEILKRNMKLRSENFELEIMIKELGIKKEEENKKEAGWYFYAIQG